MADAPPPATPDPPRAASRTRLIVLFGGQSAEHDVSCVSAREMIAAADSAKFDIQPIGVGRDGSWMLADSAREVLAAGAELPAALSASGTPTHPQEVMAAASDSPTVVFPLLHGPMGEDGTVQGLLELTGLPYVGSGVLGSAMCMDKVVAKEMAAAHDIAQPAYRAARVDDMGPQWVADTAGALGLPVFVKPANLGSSVGVSKASTIEQLTTAIELAGRYDETVVVEEAIVGREIECAVLGNLDLRASVPGEIIPGDAFYSYSDKYEDGIAKTQVPADLTNAETAEVQALAVRCAKALRVEGLARVDFFLSAERGFLLNEVNTMPGFTPISMYPQLWAASGVPYPKLIETLVDLAVERHERKHRHYSVDHSLDRADR